MARVARGIKCIRNSRRLCVAHLVQYRFLILVYLDYLVTYECKFNGQLGLGEG